MKKVIVKILVFFKKEHTQKYIVETIIFVSALIMFFCIARQDFLSNVLGTIIGFIFSTVFIYIFRIVIAMFEDAIKINKNTEELLEIYSGDVSYCKKLEFNNTSIEFLYSDCLIDNGYTYEVIDYAEKWFELDDFIMGYYDTIFSAHSNSVKYNDTTVRLDDMVCDETNKKVTFFLSRSTIYNHLLTNRAMDFTLFDSVTLRDIYEYGPVLHSFRDSKMSNHVGINALIFLNDGNLLVPQRNNFSTISKNQITSSIAVKLNIAKESQSISAKYLLEDNIIDNLTERVKINKQDIDLAKIRIKFLGMGQNVYEGGKPQFYFVVFLDNINTEGYFKLNLNKKMQGKLDVDRCIHVADYKSYKFDKDYVVLNTITKNNKIKKIKVKYEMSYLCNIWHYEEYRKRLKSNG